MGTFQEVCVYRGLGYEFAQYVREYYILPTYPNVGTMTESGVAFAFDNSTTMVPSLTIGNKDSDVQHYMGVAAVFFNKVIYVVG